MSHTALAKDVWARCRSEMATIHVSVGSREDLVCRAQALVPALRSRAAEAGYPTSDYRSFHRPRKRQRGAVLSDELGFRSYHRLKVGSLSHSGVLRYPLALSAVPSPLLLRSRLLKRSWSY